MKAAYTTHASNNNFPPDAFLIYAYAWHGNYLSIFEGINLFIKNEKLTMFLFILILCFTVFNS